MQAAGAIVGAVMKATQGQADAARVRELVLAACGQSLTPRPLAFAVQVRSGVGS